MRNKVYYKRCILSPKAFIYFIILMLMMAGVLYAAVGQSENDQKKSEQARNAKTLRELFNIQKLPHELRNTETVRLLKGESLEKSLRDLHGHYLYMRGESVMFYMGNRTDYKESELIQLLALRDIEAIMGNRRLLKIYQQLSQIDKKKASELVSKEIMYSLPIYEEKFEQHIKAYAVSYEKGAESGRSHGFAVISIENEIGIREIRYKLLALCFLAAQLELDCSQALGKVVDTALKHLEQVSDRSSFCRKDAVSLRIYNSIYNKHILGMAIAKSGLKGDKKAIKQNLGVKWKKKKLTTFDAKATEVESRSYFMRRPKADYLKGSFDAEIIEEISDDQFDYLLHNLNQ